MATWLGVCVWCRVNWNLFTLHHTHTHLTRNYICSHIYQDYTLLHYILLFNDS